MHVDPRYTGGKGDLTFANTSDPVVQANWRAYAKACRAGGAPAIVQICHPGRQSPFNAGERGFFEKNVAPSPLPMNLGDNIIARAAQKILFGTPREMSVHEIDLLVASFAENAKFVSEMGFDGVELHAAHGYLLSAFMDEGVCFQFPYLMGNIHKMLIRYEAEHPHRHLRLDPQKPHTRNHIHYPRHTCRGPIDFRHRH